MAEKRKTSCFEPIVVTDLLAVMKTKKNCVSTTRRLFYCAVNWVHWFIL